jgi:AcrR family transcriptional regulator
MTSTVPPSAAGASREPAAPRRLRRDAEANRRHILEAAGRLMAERGLATPLEDIAAAAGVGIATLYRRFPTRTDLVEALFADRLATYLADLRTALAMPDGWAALVWFLERSTARQIADRALSELIDHDPGPGLVHQLRDQVLPLAAALVDRAKRSGRLRPDVTLSDLVVLQKMLAVAGAATEPVRPGVWRRYLAFVVDGLVADRVQPSPAPGTGLSVDELEAVHTAAAPPSRPAGSPSASGPP